MQEPTEREVALAAKGWNMPIEDARTFLTGFAQENALAEEIYQRGGVDAITAHVMANDQLSARRSRAHLDAGEWDVDTALALTGSYARLDLAYQLWEEGRLPTEKLLKDLPDLWRGSDPDDTDERFLRLWQRAHRENGYRVVADGRKPPRTRMLRVYRGQAEGAPFGIAWSLDPKVAGKFAATLGGRTTVDGGALYAGWVQRVDVLGFLTKRSESEIVVNPAHIIAIEKIGDPE